MICVFLSLFPSNHFERKKPMAKNHFSRMFPAPLATAVPEEPLIANPKPEAFVASIKYGHHEKCFIVSSKMLVKEVLETALADYEGLVPMCVEDVLDEYIVKSGVRRLSMNHQIGYYIHQIRAHGSRIIIEHKETAEQIADLVDAKFTSAEIDNLMNMLLPAWFDKALEESIQQDEYIKEWFPEQIQVPKVQKLKKFDSDDEDLE